MPVKRKAGISAYLVAAVTLGVVGGTSSDSIASQRSEMLYSKGLVSFHREDYARARELFDEAVRADPGDARALYYRAMARGQLGDTRGAINDLERCLELDPSIERAVVELGYLQSRANDLDGAAATLAPARTRPAIAEDAEVLWQNNERLRSESLKSGRRYRLGARIGTEYDSNVPLAPNNDALRATVLKGASRSDGRLNFDATGAYSLYSSEWLRVVARYDFEQSLHFDLDEFNIQTHRGTVDLSSGTGQLRFGLRGSYAYVSNDGDDLVLEGVVLPWLRVVEGNWGNTDFYYRLRSQEFLEDYLDDLVTGLNHSVGVRQFFYLGRLDRYVLVGYRYDLEEPDPAKGAALGYDGHQVETGLGVQVTERFGAQAIYAYEYKDFHAPSTGREDDDHALWLRGELALADWASLVGGYKLRINHSNKVAFDYDEHIASLAIELSY